MQSNSPVSANQNNIVLPGDHQVGQTQKMSTELIMKQGNGAVGGTQRAVGSNNGAFMNLMQTQPMSGGNITKAKFK